MPAFSCWPPRDWAPSRRSPCGPCNPMPRPCYVYVSNRDGSPPPRAHSKVPAFWAMRPVSFRPHRNPRTELAPGRFPSGMIAVHGVLAQEGCEWSHGEAYFPPGAVSTGVNGTDPVAPQSPTAETAAAQGPASTQGPASAGPLPAALVQAVQRGELTAQQAIQHFVSLAASRAGATGPLRHAVEQQLQALIARDPTVQELFLRAGIRVHRTNHDLRSHFSAPIFLATYPLCRPRAGGPLPLQQPLGSASRCLDSHSALGHPSQQRPRSEASRTSSREHGFKSDDTLSSTSTEPLAPPPSALQDPAAEPTSQAPTRGLTHEQLLALHGYTADGSRIETTDAAVEDNPLQGNGGLAPDPQFQSLDPTPTMRVKYTIVLPEEARVRFAASAVFTSTTRANAQRSRRHGPPRRGWRALGHPQCVAWLRGHCCRWKSVPRGHGDDVLRWFLGTPPEDGTLLGFRRTDDSTIVASRGHMTLLSLGRSPGRSASPRLSYARRCTPRWRCSGSQTGLRECTVANARRVAKPQCNCPGAPGRNAYLGPIAGTLTRRSTRRGAARLELASASFRGRFLRPIEEGAHGPRRRAHRRHHPHGDQSTQPRARALRQRLGHRLAGPWSNRSLCRPSEPTEHHKGPQSQRHDPVALGEYNPAGHGCVGSHSPASLTTPRGRNAVLLHLRNACRTSCKSFEASSEGISNASARSPKSLSSSPWISPSMKDTPAAIR